MFDMLTGVGNADVKPFPLPPALIAEQARHRGNRWWSVGEDHEVPMTSTADGNIVSLEQTLGCSAGDSEDLRFLRRVASSFLKRFRLVEYGPGKKRFESVDEKKAAPEFTEKNTSAWRCRAGIRLGKYMALNIVRRFGYALAKPAIERVRILERDDLNRRLFAKEWRAELEASEQKKRSKSAKTQEQIFEDALKAARQDRTPNVAGARGLGVLRVADPTEDAPLRARVYSTSDPVLNMAAHGQLNDGYGQALRVAAKTDYEKLLQDVEIGSLRALDPRSERVDGGCSVPDSATRADALTKLRQIDNKLGPDGAQLMRLVIGSKMNVKAAAKSIGLGVDASSDNAKIFRGMFFRRCLDKLVEGLEMAGRGRGRQRTADRFDELARDSNTAPLA